MTATIEKNTLVELEFELNRSDILHCRSLIIDTPSSDEFIVLTPAPVEHGYAFKAGDRIDLYASLLSSGDIDHTLHIKTTVIQVEKNTKSSQLHLKKSGFARRISNSHFHMLRSNASILLEPQDSKGHYNVTLASVRSFTLNSMHITTTAPMDKGSAWRGSLTVNETVFNFQGKADPDGEKDEKTTEHSATIHFNSMTHEAQIEMARTIESIQIKHIQSRAGLTLHDVYVRSDLQDPLILEHLVPRSQQRVALDILELIGWLVLILMSFDVVLAIPPEGNLFDRFFQVKRSIVWDKEQLKNVPFLLSAEFMIFISTFSLHQYIYYRGSTRVRWSLWVLYLLTLLLFLSVQSHL